MKIREFGTPRAAITHVYQDFKERAQLVPNRVWQGTDVSNKPEMGIYEVEDVAFSFEIATDVVQYHRASIGPNLPWADNHFLLERVSGQPINPGETWKEWPYGHSADKFRGYGPDADQFNHSYAERYWPRLAGVTKGGRLEPGTELVNTVGDFDHLDDLKDFQRRGIRYLYGDLADVINLLVKNPDTRNAYLPVWFPEDTGVVHGGRTPCSLGYLFRMRRNELSVFYDIRSCDLKRHFRDDVYLTVRLLLWVLQRCKEVEKARPGFWQEVDPGKFTMHIGSLHVFKNDWREL